MCGIAGIVDFENDLLKESRALSAMLDTISHRGPDSAGTFMTHQAALGHRRLIVVDPAGGSQPMTRSIGQGTYTIVYNGELYNTPELRQELVEKGHTFFSHSDTEALLLSYIEWGPSCVEKLNGIFAFAVWDEKKQRVFLARDRMGVKPLFIARTRHALLFASEIKAILAHPDITPVLKENGLLELFALAPARTAGKTLFSGIEELKPGECMIYSPLGTYIHRYWQYISVEHTDSLKQTTEKLAWLIADATKRQLVSDVPVCTFLSGGVDSSTLSAIAAKQAAEKGCILRTFSVDFADNDKYFTRSVFQPSSDSDYIDIMRRHIGSDHIMHVVSTEDLVSSLKDAMIARDLPGMADVDSSLLLFCQEIKGYATVALSGECADEIFGGYPWFYRDDLLTLDMFPWANSLELRRNVMSKDLSWLGIEDYAKSRYLDTIEETPLLGDENQKERRRRQMFYLNIKWFMANLLERKDRMSMASGLEVRVPFCDHRIAEYAWNIPWDIKNIGGMEKGILRLAVKDLLPECIFSRKKSPYPKTHNPEYTRLVSIALKETLVDKDAPIHALIDRHFVEDMLDSLSIVTPWFGQLMTGPQLFAFLLQLNMWLAEYKVRITV
ncbi:MAG: asparagine synthase (glutamine-hydrolyzing) [Eubacteriales bacterium]|nr:asparagine synthase (glutamine-hydrolyzing) [Eubacteriales bacterium]